MCGRPFSQIQSHLYLATVLFLSDIPTMDVKLDQATVPIYNCCSICHRLHKDPKYLPCSHSYCEGCLIKLQEGSGLTCILCEVKSTTLGASVVIPAYRQVGKKFNKHSVNVQIHQYSSLKMPSKILNNGEKMGSHGVLH